MNELKEQISSIPQEVIKALKEGQREDGYILAVAPKQDIRDKVIPDQANKITKAMEKMDEFHNVTYFFDDYLVENKNTNLETCPITKLLNYLAKDNLDEIVEFIEKSDSRMQPSKSDLITLRNIIENLQTNNRRKFKVSI